MNIVHRKKGFFGFLASVALAATLGAGSASADVVGYNLTSLNISGTGPFAQVQIDRAAGGLSAVVTFYRLGSYALVGSDIANLNVSTTATVASFTYTCLVAGCTPTPFSSTGSGTVDGWGTFTNTTKAQSASAPLTMVRYVLTNTGTAWSSAGTVLTVNSKSEIASAHVTYCVGTSCGPDTGFAAGGTEVGGDQFVPIPAAAWLFGSGLIGLIGIARRRRTA